MKFQTTFVKIVYLILLSSTWGCSSRNNVPAKVVASSITYNTNRIVVGIRPIHDAAWTRTDTAEPYQIWKDVIGASPRKDQHQRVLVEHWIGNRGSGHEEKHVVKTETGSPLYEQDYYYSGRFVSMPDGTSVEITLVVDYDWTRNMIILHYLNDPLDVSDPYIIVAKSNTVEAAECILGAWGKSIDAP
jgi:hypothetical protein